MTSTGIRPTPDPDDPTGVDAPSKVESVPDEENVDPAAVEDDLALDPDEKRNATDGYAPADDDAETTTVDDLET